VRALTGSPKVLGAPGRGVRALSMASLLTEDSQPEYVTADPGQAELSSPPPEAIAGGSVADVATVAPAWPSSPLALEAVVAKESPLPAAPLFGPDGMARADASAWGSQAVLGLRCPCVLEVDGVSNSSGQGSAPAALFTEVVSEAPLVGGFGAWDCDLPPATPPPPERKPFSLAWTPPDPVAPQPTAHALTSSPMADAATTCCAAQAVAAPENEEDALALRATAPKLAGASQASQTMNSKTAEDAMRRLGAAPTLHTSATPDLVRLRCVEPASKAAKGEAKWPRQSESSTRAPSSQGHAASSISQSCSAADSASHGPRLASFFDMLETLME